MWVQFVVDRVSSLRNLKTTFLNSISTSIVHRVKIIKADVASCLCNVYRTSCPPNRFVTMDDRVAEVLFAYREYDYRLNWTTPSFLAN